MLRRWWREPELTCVETDSYRLAELQSWIQRQEALQTASLHGAKHPLLSLETTNIEMAWGDDVKFIWAFREIDESIDSLTRLGWWSDPDRIQRKLFRAAQGCIDRTDRESLVVNFSDTLADPHGTVLKLAHFLGIEVGDEQISRAANLVVPRAIRLSDTTPACAPEFHSVGNGAIAATMLASNNELIVEAAVKSVIEYVDTFLLIDTGIDDSTIDLVCRIAGDKFALVTYQWNNDFAAARNFALREAKRYDCTWAITIDTDERIDFGTLTPKQLKEHLLREHTIQSWLVPARSRYYSKDRILKLDAPIEWRGRTHEALTGTSHGQRKTLDGVCFDELPKNAAQQRHKLQRDLMILREETVRFPENGRWWYYLGQTLEELGQQKDAIDAFEHCFDRSGWAEEKAWACFRAAVLLSDLGDHLAAVQMCALGLSAQPETPELAWMAALCNFRAGADHDAISWSQICIAMGHAEGMCLGKERIFHREYKGWYDGPFDVLRFAYQRNGEKSLAEQAEAKYEEAKQMRLERV